ncbi:MAG: hypothetical protein OHK0029_32780 [Armatimonadaceae bacterium]
MSEELVWNGVWNKARLPETFSLPVRWGAIRTTEMYGPSLTNISLLEQRLLNLSPAFAPIETLLADLGAKDRYTRRHSEEVAWYASEMTRLLNLPYRDRVAVEVAALLHDIGKTRVRGELLRHPEKLSVTDYDEVKQHAEWGAAMAVEACAGMAGMIPVRIILDGIRYHHEAWNGSGYPSGIGGQKIPLAARIIAVADAYSALTTDRPYRSAGSPEAAMKVLRENAGVLWDPCCVIAFSQVFRRMHP